jgi:hypothetical protein
MLPRAGVLTTTFTRSRSRGLQLLSLDHAPTKVLLQSLGANAWVPSLPEFTCKTTVDATSIYMNVSQAEGPTHGAHHQYHSRDVESSPPTNTSIFIASGSNDAPLPDTNNQPMTSGIANDQSFMIPLVNGCILVWATVHHYCSTL